MMKHINMHLVKNSYMWNVNLDTQEDIIDE